MSHDETKMAVETPSCRMTRPEWPMRRRHVAWWDQNGHWDAVVSHDETKWPLRRRHVAWWDQNGHWDAVVSHDETKMAVETPSCRMMRPKWPLRRHRVAWRDQNGHWDTVMSHDDRTHVSIRFWFAT